MPIKQPNTPLLITINSVGVPQSYTGTVNVGSSATVTSAATSVLATASRVTGTISTLVGATLADNTKFVSASSMAVVGGNGFQSVDGTAAQLTEGVKLTSSGQITGGNGYNQFPGLQSAGGNATVILDGTKTSWPSFVVTTGSDDTAGGNIGVGGNAILNLTSSQASATLGITFGNSGSNFALESITVAGTTLVNVTPTFAGGYTPSGGGGISIDFSGCILNNTSMLAICNGLTGVSISGGFATLNIGGTCDIADATTLAAITVLVGIGWSVTNN